MDKTYEIISKYVSFYVFVSYRLEKFKFFVVFHHKKCTILSFSTKAFFIFKFEKKHSLTILLYMSWQQNIK